MEWAPPRHSTRHGPKKPATAAGSTPRFVDCPQRCTRTSATHRQKDAVSNESPPEAARSSRRALDQAPRHDAPLPGGAPGLPPSISNYSSARSTPRRQGPDHSRTSHRPTDPLITVSAGQRQCGPCTTRRRRTSWQERAQRLWIDSLSPSGTPIILGVHPLRSSPVLAAEISGRAFRSGSQLHQSVDDGMRWHEADRGDEATSCFLRFRFVPPRP